MRLRLGAVAERLDAILSRRGAQASRPTSTSSTRSSARSSRPSSEARRDGHPDRALPVGEDARRLRLQVPAVGRPEARARARHGPLRRHAENVLLFGPPGVGKTHLAIALGRAVVEAGHSVLFVTATALLAALAKAQTEGKLAEQLALLRQAQAARHRRARLPAVREAQRPPLLPARRPTLRARQHAASPPTSSSRSGATSSATRCSPPPSSTACSTTATP